MLTNGNVQDGDVIKITEMRKDGNTQQLTIISANHTHRRIR